MAERRFIVIRYMGETPTLATCTRCHVKFFTPLELIANPQKAEAHLREKYRNHTCKPSFEAPIENKT